MEENIPINALVESLAEKLCHSEPSGDHLNSIIRRVEREIILRKLKSCNWNKTQTSAALGMNRTQLYRKLAIHGITQ